MLVCRRLKSWVDWMTEDVNLHQRNIKSGRFWSIVEWSLEKEWRNTVCSWLMTTRYWRLLQTVSVTCVPTDGGGLGWRPWIRRRSEGHGGEDRTMSCESKITHMYHLLTLHSFRVSSSPGLFGVSREASAHHGCFISNESVTTDTSHTESSVFVILQYETRLSRQAVKTMSSSSDFLSPSGPEIKMGVRSSSSCCSHTCTHLSSVPLLNSTPLCDSLSVCDISDLLFISRWCVYLFWSLVVCRCSLKIIGRAPIILLWSLVSLASTGHKCHQQTLQQHDQRTFCSHLNEASGPLRDDGAEDGCCVSSSSLTAVTNQKEALCYHADKHDNTVKEWETTALVFYFVFLSKLFIINPQNTMRTVFSQSCLHFINMGIFLEEKIQWVCFLKMTCGGEDLLLLLLLLLLTLYCVSYRDQTSWRSSRRARRFLQRSWITSAEDWPGSTPPSTPRWSSCDTPVFTRSVVSCCSVLYSNFLISIILLTWLTTSSLCVCLCVCVQDKMLDVYWLLCVCIRTIEHADNTGSLFAFAPEFYLNVAMNAYSALKNYFSPANSMEELPGETSSSWHLPVTVSWTGAAQSFMCVFSSLGYEDTLTQLAAILAKHFADPRIVGTGKTSVSCCFVPLV